ncbi:MAG: SPOCS domain-containing protein [Anaerovoracaceae bacterium]|jgi:hypothetical protein
MEYKKDFLDEENIPDFALQPAKPASTFDPTIYDKLFENMRQSAAAKEESPEGEKLVAADVTTEQPEVASTSAEQPPEVEPESVTASAEQPTTFEPEAVEVSEEQSAALESKDVTVLSEQLAADEPETIPVTTEQPIAAELEAVPVSTEPSTVDEPATEPVSAEIPAEPEESAVSVAKAMPVHMPKKPLPVETEAASDDDHMKKVKYTDFRKLSPVVIYVEEDVLITDAKPDMSRMLSVEGSCQLAERNVPTGAHGIQSMRITGDLKIQALYTAEDDADEPAVVSLDTKILFREDCMVKGEPNSVITLCPDLRSIEWERINERKFRVRAAIEVNMREYCDKELRLFDDIKKDQMQFLQDEIEFTDIAMRKTEIMEVAEEIRLREGAPEIDKILCYNINLVENHKQISNEKAMVNVTAYLNVLYKSDGCPVFYKCNTEFTQFIRVDEGFDYPLIAGRAFFDILDCSLTAKRDEDGHCAILCLNMDVETTLEYYRQVHEPCIVDLYHYSKDVEYDTVRRELNCFCGSGAADIPIREIVDVPERYGKAEQVIYVSGSPKIKNRQGLPGKIMVEGVLPVRLVCIGGESGKLPFTIDRELDFRAMLDVPDCNEGMELDDYAVLKELSFDLINNKQIAVNAEIAVSGYAFKKTDPELIHTVRFLEKGEEKAADPDIIVYAAKEGDTVWKVAKKYHTPLARVRSMNDLAEHEEIRPGTKILIVR